MELDDMNKPDYNDCLDNTSDADTSSYEYVVKTELDASPEPDYNDCLDANLDVEIRNSRVQMTLDAMSKPDCSDCLDAKLDLDASSYMVMEWQAFTKLNHGDNCMLFPVFEVIIIIIYNYHIDLGVCFRDEVKRVKNKSQTSHKPLIKPDDFSSCIFI